MAQAGAEQARKFDAVACRHVVLPNPSRNAALLAIAPLKCNGRPLDTSASPIRSSRAKSRDVTPTRRLRHVSKLRPPRTVTEDRAADMPLEILAPIPTSACG